MSQRSESVRAWVEKQYEALKLVGPPDGCAAALATLRRDYTDTRTLFGLDATDAEVAEKQQRLRGMASAWLESLQQEPLAVRVKALQWVDFLAASPSDRELEQAPVIEKLNRAFVGAWRYHGFADGLSEEQQSLAHTLRQLNALPASFLPVATQLGRVWVLGEDARVSAQSFDSYSQAFGDPSAALQEAAESAGLELYCGIESLLAQLEDGAKSFRLGGGVLGDRRIEIQANADGQIRVTGAGQAPHTFATLNAYLEAVAAALASDGGAAHDSLPLGLVLNHKLTASGKRRNLRPSVSILLEREAKIGSRAVRFKDCESPPLDGELALWHPIDDFEGSPRFRFQRPIAVRNAWLGTAHLALVLHDGSPVSRWLELGDASTDTTQLYLLRVQDFEAVLEQVSPGDLVLKGTKTNPFQSVSLGGVAFNVLETVDGNARVHGGLDAGGKLVCVIIVTGDIAWSGEGYVRGPAWSGVITVSEGIPARTKKGKART
jgi:hypothetical protein